MLKKLLLLAGFGLSLGATAQNIVTTTPQRQSIVLEEYTGIYCVFCPDGHRRAKELKADYPSRVVLVNIHTGTFANPQSGDPDFRTQYGATLAAQTGLTGYPTGTINREVFPDFSNTMAMSRTNWRDAGQEVLERVSPVNIGATSSYDPSTRQLTLNVEAYYTADATQPYNLINIAVLQDSVPGPQTGGNTYNPADWVNGQYIHAHMLRDLITGQWGDTISTTTNGSLWSKTYTYTLPADVNGVTLNDNHVELAIYVGEGKTMVKQGITLGLNASNDGNTSPVYGQIAAVGNTIQDGISGAATSFTGSFDNILSSSQDFTISLSGDAPADWNADFTINGNTYTGSHTMNIAANSSVNIDVNVTPGSNPKLAAYQLNIAPTSDLQNGEMMEYHLASGLTDLVVNGSGAFADGNNYQFETIFTQGLSAAGVTQLDVTNGNLVTEALKQGALSDVKNMYYNVAWRFPAVTEEEATQLMNFLDNNGNLFISGQDFGWDISSGQGNGGPQAKNLFTNYIQAIFRSDGGASNSSLVAETGDNIFGTTSTSAIADVYNGSFYPDEIFPVMNAEAIFNYNGSASIAGLRTYNDYKLVYLGIGLEMVADASVQDHILNQTSQWFAGTISTEEFDFAMKGVKAYPNPGNGNIKLDLPARGEYEISVTDLNGKLIHSETISTSSAQKHELDFTKLAAGAYLLNTRMGEKEHKQKLIIE